MDIRTIREIIKTSQQFKTEVKQDFKEMKGLIKEAQSHIDTIKIKLAEAERILAEAIELNNK
ncbi:hypothetical protein [Rufibacter sp. LB8]|uniref:hypothetical protein n=1 Tax=Rufibacter sp. LB8 TaxID=2777781 RepID=UPI00178C28E1|nr:hypothetical protein [Rufibacter sp. LB8]